MLTDTHCHFEDERYDQDRDQTIKANLDELAFAVNVTADPNKLEAVVALAQRYDKLYASLGVHPHYALHIEPEDAQKRIQEVFRHDKIIGIGECGLDYFFKNQDLAARTEFEVREAQRQLFQAQIDLSLETGLPLLVHTRDEQEGWDAYQDIMSILDEKKVERAVIHSFSGDLKFANDFIERGYYLGISGILTFDKSGKLPEVVKQIPLKHLLLETDAPYLTPPPHRGKRNEPRYTKFIAQKIADIKNIKYEEVLEITEQNARKLFRIEV